MRNLLNVIFSLSLIMLTACSDSVNSENIKTSGISAIMSVVSKDNAQTEVSAHLNVDSNPVNLSVGDSLVATANGISTIMVRQAAAGDYLATFPFDGAFQYTVALTRVNDPDAPNSTVTLPSVFTISQPVNNQSFPAGAAINIGWSPSNINSTFGSLTNTLTLKYSTTCTSIAGQIMTSSGVKVITDSGTYTLSQATLSNDFSATIDTSKTCLCGLSLTRSTTGTIDPALAGGSISGVQQRVRSVFVNF